MAAYRVRAKISMFVEDLETASADANELIELTSSHAKDRAVMRNNTVRWRVTYRIRLALGAPAP